MLLGTALVLVAIAALVAVRSSSSDDSGPAATELRQDQDQRPGPGGPEGQAVDAQPDGTAEEAPSQALDPVRIDLVDTTRPVVTGGLRIDSVRRLPTTIWRPSTSGPHPLVVFAHGYQVGPSTYARFCAALAAQGYVVAAPSFPLADESRGNGLDREDIPQQARDVGFVIDALRASDPTVDQGPVAVIGHSDGGTVALLVAERVGSMHPAVGAVVAIAPDSLKGSFTSSPPPLLIIHGIDDQISAFWNSEVAFAAFVGSRWLLALEGADHLDPIVGGTPWTPVIDAAVVEFLDAQMSGGTRDTEALTRTLGQLELSRVTHAD